MRAGILGLALTLIASGFQVEPALGQNQESGRPPAVRSIEAIRGLSAQEADSGRVASIEGVVTLWWEDQSRWFIHDGTSGIYMNKWGRPFEFEFGDRVRVEGVIQQGSVTHVIVPERIEKMGSGEAPEPKVLDRELIRNARYDADWVEVEALVTSVTVDDSKVDGVLCYRLGLISGGVAMDCVLPVSDPELLESLEGARISVQGVATREIEETKRRELTIFTDDSQWIDVVTPAEEVSKSTRDSWGSLRPETIRESEAFVRLVGRVGALGRQFAALQNGDDVAFVWLPEDSEWHVGDVVEFYGGAYLREDSIWIRDASLSTSAEKVDVDLLHIDPSQLTDPSLSGRRIRVRGRYLAEFRGESDWNGYIFKSEGPMFEVVSPQSSVLDIWSDLIEDATYEVTGVLSIREDRTENPRVWVEARHDIRYSKRPPIPPETLLGIVVPLMLAVFLMLVLSLVSVSRTRRIAARLGESESRLKEVNEWLERKVDSGATALRVSSSTLSVAMDSSSDALLVSTREAVIQTFNQAFRDMWDLPGSVKPGGSADVATLLVSEKVASPPDFLARIQEILAREHESSFDTLWLSDGRIIEQVSRPRYVDGQPAGRVWSFRDVTAREEQRLRVEGIVTSAMDAIVGVDAERRIELLNPAAELLFGRSEDEMKGVPLDEALILESGTVERNGPATDISVLGASCLVRRGDGTSVPVEMTQFTTQVGNRSMGAYFLRDISQRIEMEKKRLELEAELRQTQKLRAVSSLAGGVAHDFNNIIGAIILNARYLRDGLSDSDALSEVVDDILSSSKQAKELVTEVLTFSRQDDAAKTRIDLAEVVRSSLSEIRPRIPKNVALRIEGLDGVAFVNGNETQLRQVFSNLGINAIHAMEDMGGALAFDLSRRVEASVEDPAERSVVYVVSVSDTGCGIPEDVRERLFEPFYTTKEPGKGTGLGLAVVHGVIEAHGGRVEVESELGVGATFRVILPANSIRV